MKLDEITAIAEVAQAILTLAALIGTVVVSVFVYYGTKRLAILEHARSIRDAWVAIDSLALSSDEMVKIADNLQHPEFSTQSVQEMRKRWFAYALLNALISTVHGARQGLIHDPKAALVRAKTQLRMLVQDDILFELTQLPSNDQDIAALARALRDELKQKKDAVAGLGSKALS